MNISRTPSISKYPRALRITGIAFVVLLAVMIGASGLIYPSEFAPLLAGSLLVAVVVVVALFKAPVWIIYFALLIVFFPSGILPQQVHSYLNRILTIAAAGIWLVKFIVNRWQIRVTVPMVSMLGFVIWAAITMLWAGNLEEASSDVQTYLLRFLLFMFLIPNLVRNRKDFDGFLNAVVLIGWIFIFASIYTILVKGYTPGTRLEVFGANENEIGFLSLVTMVGNLWMATKPSAHFRQLRIVLAVTFMVIMLALVAMSGSRGGAISWLITLGLFMLFRPTRPWGTLGLTLVLIGAMTLPFLFTTTLNRFFSEDRGLLGRREMLWQSGWELIKDHPWVGVGVANASIEVVPYVRFASGLTSTTGMNIHNPFLTIWAETGAVGIILYMGMIVTALISSILQFLRRRQIGETSLLPYFGIVIPIFVGYMTSWIKGGGVEKGFTSFLMFTLLILPSCIEAIPSLNKNPQDDAHEA